MTESESGLGSYLRSAREARGLTLEQVASSTKISIRILQALEADHYDDLPAKPFVRGFVTSYVRIVGMNPQEVLSRFETFLDEKTKTWDSRDNSHAGYAFEKKDGEKNRTYLWMTLAGCVVVGGVGLMILKPALKRRQVYHVDALKTVPGEVKTSEPIILSDKIPAAPETKVAETKPPETKPPETKPPEIKAPEIKPPEIKLVELKVEVKPVATKFPEPIMKIPPPKVEPKIDKVAVETKAPVIKVEEPKKPVSVTTVTVPGVDRDSAEPGRKPSPDDPMNKGDTLAAREVKEKVVLKTLSDVWVRYQVDDRPSMRIVIPAGKLLVLRGRKDISVQVSNPKAVQIRYKANDYISFETGRTLTTRRENAFLVFPYNASKESDVIFNDLAPLPKTPDPISSDASNVRD